MERRDEAHGKNMSNSKERILFVDDDRNFLDGVRRSLQGQRHIWEMVFVDGVDKAMEELGRGGVDVVLSDVMMPGKDGFALLRAIRGSEALRDTPVIMITGIGDDHLKAAALNGGADDLISKPVGHEDLLARIRSTLRLKKAKDELKEANATLDIRVTERTAQLERSQVEIIWRLAKVGEIRDGHTGSHIVRVGNYARLIAESLGLPRLSVELLFLTAPLHDIGKVGIPDAILQKPGRLNPAERLVMQDHCAIGAQILLEDPTGMQSFLEWKGQSDVRRFVCGTDNPFLSMSASIAMTHHERWDGTGYPTGLAGDDIPLDGRIATVADVFDAICSERCYKPAIPEEAAHAIIHAESGKQFDPEVVRAFDRVVEEVRKVRIRLPDDVHAAV